MRACPQCQTLNPDGESTCLACRSSLTTGGETAPQGAATRCPNGHPIDPSWKTCPYCSREQPRAATTVLESAPPGSAPLRGGAKTTRFEEAANGSAGRRTRLEGDATIATPPPLPRAAGRATRLESPNDLPAEPAPFGAKARPTRLEEPTGTPAARRTILHEAGSASPPPPPAATPAATIPQPLPSPTSRPREATAANPDDRRLVAVLAAPELVPGGRVFPVRAGKNLLGADAKNDVCLREDSQVSGEHALILHRGAAFYLADRMSTNGTWINGEEVDPTSPAVILNDRDRIRCGETELIFLTLESPISDMTNVNVGGAVAGEMG